MKKYLLTRILLILGAAFFFTEAIIHGFGLPILEHDKIFLPTHDRYIALFALTYAGLLILINTNLQKYHTLFIFTMIGILLSIANATFIAFNGGYIKFFPVLQLDAQLGIIGIFAYLRYPLVWISFLKKL